MGISCTLILFCTIGGGGTSGPGDFETTRHAERIGVQGGTYYLSQGTTYRRGRGDRAVDVLRSGRVTYEGKNSVTIAVEHLGKFHIRELGTITVDPRQLRARGRRIVCDLPQEHGILLEDYTLVVEGGKIRREPPKRLEYYNPITNCVRVENRTADPVTAVLVASRNSVEYETQVTIEGAGQTGPIWVRSPDKVRLESLGKTFELSNVRTLVSYTIVLGQDRDEVNVQVVESLLEQGEIPKQEARWANRNNPYACQVVIGNDTPYTLVTSLSAAGGTQEYDNRFTWQIRASPKADKGPFCLMRPKRIELGPGICFLDKLQKPVKEVATLVVEGFPCDATVYITFRGDDCAYRVEYGPLIGEFPRRLNTEQVGR